MYVGGQPHWKCEQTLKVRKGHLAQNGKVLCTLCKNCVLIFNTISVESELDPAPLFETWGYFAVLSTHACI